MESHLHTLSDLFCQLGLPDDASSIARFIQAHHPLAGHVALADANFWNGAQRGFLREQLVNDSDWAVLVDSFDASLR